MSVFDQLSRTTWPDLRPGAARAGREPGWARLPSGLVVPEACVPAPRPIAIDLFCGCGGFSLGIIQAGFAVLLGADHDCAAAETYMYNLGAYPAQFVFVEPSDRERLERSLTRTQKRGGVMHTSGGARGGQDMAPGYPGVGHFLLGDLQKVTGESISTLLGIARGELDLVVGGPPCQGFSMAGKREVVDPRNSLVFDFVRLVCELQPRSMVFENVPGIASMVTPDGNSVVDELCRILERGEFASYEASRRILSENPTARKVSRDRRPKAEAPKVEQLGLFRGAT